MLLRDHVVIVTGAAQPGSIGEAIAARVAEEGGFPVVTSRKAADAEACARRIGRGAGHACDLTKEADCERLVRDVLRAQDRLDGIVHNAGAPITDWDRPFVDTPVEEFAKVFDVDVLGSIRLTRRALPAMIERKRGALVFTSSTAAVAGYQHLHEFAPSKAGALGLMKGLAAEVAHHGIRSNAVAYGNIGSLGTLEALTPEQRESLAMESPMMRWGTPREAAGAVVFLLSDLAGFVNGQTLVIDGGTVMR